MQGIDLCLVFAFGYRIVPVLSVEKTVISPLPGLSILVEDRWNVCVRPHRWALFGSLGLFVSLGFGVMVGVILLAFSILSRALVTSEQVSVSCSSIGDSGKVASVV